MSLGKVDEKEQLKTQQREALEKIREAEKPLYDALKGYIAAASGAVAKGTSTPRHFAAAVMLCSGLERGGHHQHGVWAG